VSTPVLEALRELLDEDLDGVTSTPEGLRAVADARWGEVTLGIDQDEDGPDADEIALRVSAAIAPPAGAGHELLLWALSTNTQYWAVKIGLTEDGMLLVHADLDADGPEPDGLLAADVMDRVESILQLLDEDLSEWCLVHGFGTPAQRARWESRRPERALDEDDDDDDEE